MFRFKGTSNVSTPGHDARQTARAADRRRRPTLEGLESRELKTIGLSGDTIRILGTDLVDHVVVRYEKGSAFSLLDDRVWVTVDNANGLEEASFAVWKPASGSIGVRRNVDHIFCALYGEDDTFWNLSSIRSYAYGDLGDDDLYGGNGVDNLYGGAGRDALYGGDGDDFLHGDGGYDGGDFDVIFGGLGADTLYGGEGDDLLFDNTAQSSDGDVDHLDGGADGGTLYGGWNDQFANGEVDTDGISNLLPDTPWARRKGRGDRK